MSAREKISPSPTSVEPKKSVRLAQKRKLREESGPPNVSEDEYYFTPYQFSKSSSPARGKSQGSRSSSPATVSSPTIKKMRGKTSNDSSGELSSNNSTTTVSPVSKVYAPSPKARTLSPITSVVPPARAVVPGVSVSEDSNSSLGAGASSSSPLKRKLAKISALSSAKEEVLEEEKWLDALESGKLEELDEELRQMKNPKLLTARQRAIIEKKDRDIYGFNIDDEFIGIGILGKEKEKLVITQEMIKLKAEKTEKRRQLAQEKKEIDKKKTMDRLLKKQQSKAVKGTAKPRGQKKVTDYKITFVSKADQNIISFPIGYPLPFQDGKPISVPVSIKCGVEGCTNLKKYCCSKTKKPLCSLKCYKKNISLHSS